MDGWTIFGGLLDLLFPLVLWVVVAGGVGYAIGNAKGNGRLGFWLGLLLGLIGWGIVLVVNYSKDNRPKCPECKGAIVEGARRCKNCGVVLAGSDSPTSDEAANQEQGGRTRELF